MNKIDLTTANGRKVDNNQNSLTAGSRGPVLMQDVYLQEKLAHFDREEIPERIVHAKGAGAHGTMQPKTFLSLLKMENFLNGKYMYKSCQRWKPKVMLSIHLM